MPTIESFKKNLKLHLSSEKKTKERFYIGKRRLQILHARMRLQNADLNENLHSRNLSESNKCQCGEVESTPHYLLNCTRHNAARKRMFTSINQLGIPEKKTNRH